MLSLRDASLALLVLCLCGQSVVRAEESIIPSTTAPPQVSPALEPSTAVPKPDLSTAKPTADAAATPGSNPSTESAATPGATTTATPAAKKPSDPLALLYSDNVAPGPFEAKRKLLLMSIKAAKKQGFGITGYLNELNKVEDQIKAGDPAPQLEERVDAIAEGLQDQLKRSQILKSQRPTGAAHAAGSTVSDSGGGGAPRPHKGMDAMLQELRAKYGDKLPAGMGGLSDGDLKEKLMNSDMAKDYLKKLNH